MSDNITNLEYDPYPTMTPQENNDGNIESLYNITESPEQFNIQPYDINYCTGIGNYEFIETIPNQELKTIIELKELLLNIVHQKKEIIEINNNEYKNKEIDELIEKINKLFSNEKFYKLQNELNEIEKNLQKEMNKSKENLQTFDYFIDFLSKISYDNIEKNEFDNLIKNSNNICDKIYKNNNLEILRNNYIQKRKELNSYIYFIQKLNNYNISNICPICFSNQVNKYLDPCGHTYCEKCLKKSNNDHNNDKQCMVCRKTYQKVRSIFFV